MRPTDCSNENPTICSGHFVDGMKSAAPSMFQWREKELTCFSASHSDLKQEPEEKVVMCETFGSVGSLSSTGEEEPIRHFKQEQSETEISRLQTSPTPAGGLDQIVSARECVLFFDSRMRLYKDAHKSVYFTGVLYQRNDDSRYFLDEKLTVQVIMCPAKEEEAADCNMEEREPLQPEYTRGQSSLPTNCGFTRQQTLHFIDLIRQHLQEEGELPKNLNELRERLKWSRGKKKMFWKDVACKLSREFGETFEPEKVQRKWYTLEDAYRKLKCNNRSMRSGAMKFQFFDEMDALLCDQHDISFSVVGTAKGVEIRRPDVLDVETCSASESVTTDTCKDERSKGQDSGLLDFLRESELARQRRHEEILAQMSASQQSLERILLALLQKPT